MHILINRTCCNVTLDDRTYILIFASFGRGDIPPRPTSLSLYNHSLLVKFKVLRLPYYWSTFRPLSLLGQGPRPNIYLGLHPYNSASKLQISPPIRGEKWGFDVLNNKSHTFLWLPHMRMLLRVSHNYSWRFGAHDVSLNASGGTLFLISYGEMQILWLAFFLEIWVG